MDEQDELPEEDIKTPAPQDEASPPEFPEMSDELEVDATAEDEGTKTIEEELAFEVEHEATTGADADEDDDTDLQDRVTELESVIEELKSQIQEAGQEPQWPNPFLAKLNTDGTFTELLVADGTLGNFTEGRSNATNNAYISLNSTAQNNAVVFPMQDNDTNGNPITAWVVMSASSSVAAGGSTLAFAKKTTPETIASGNFTSATVTSISAATGGVFRVRASGTYDTLTNPQVGATLNVGGATLTATAISATSANAGSWFFEAELTLALVAAGASASLSQGSVRMHETNVILGSVSAEHFAIGNGSQVAFTQTGLLSGTGTVTLTALIASGHMTLEAYTLEKLS